MHVVCDIGMTAGEAARACGAASEGRAVHVVLIAGNVWQRQLEGERWGEQGEVERSRLVLGTMGSHVSTSLDHDEEPCRKLITTKRCLVWRSRDEGGGDDACLVAVGGKMDPEVSAVEGHSKPERHSSV